MRIESSPDPSAYVSALIGRDWERDGLNCWTLVRQVQRDLFGRDLPVVIDGGAYPDLDERSRLFREHGERSRWRHIKAPEHGAVALMSRGALEAIHCGVFLALEAGGVLHTDDPHGVVFDTLLDLETRRWRPAFYIPR